jgi:ribosome biogenesis GTPase
MGFDQWFQADVSDLRQEGRDIARISAVDRGSYLIRNETREVPAELAGKLYFQAESPVDLPCVGDWVTVQYHSNDTAAIIHEVFPRKTFLRRKSAGEKVDFQMIAANIDVAFIVQSCRFDFNARRMDRYLVMAADGGVEPIVVLTKTDLITPEELEQELAAIGTSTITARVLALSNVTGNGFDEFQQVLVPARTYCLLGSSGVGKTTLINRLIGQDAFDTKAVSGTGEGTHTTARRQLIVLNQGSMLIDTPGMRELGLLGVSEGVTQGFQEIFRLSRDSLCELRAHTGTRMCGASRSRKRCID